jgi:hypothetical protein
MTKAHPAETPQLTVNSSNCPMHECVETIDCATLNQFWNLVSPIGELFGQRHTAFVFRGQRNSEWTLVPKMFRPDIIDKYKLGMMARLTDHPGQFFFEWVLLQNFIIYCDARGLAIPGTQWSFAGISNRTTSLDSME